MGTLGRRSTDFLGCGGQDPNLHGEADAGTQRAAVVRMTQRAAAETFMVLAGRGCGSCRCCLRSLCRDLLQFRLPFIGSQDQ